MKKRNITLRKRGLALFLALVMCFGMLQTTAWAIEDVSDGDDGESAGYTDSADNGSDGENSSTNDGGDDADTGTDDADAGTGGDSSDADTGDDDGSDTDADADAGDGSAVDKDTPDTNVGGGDVNAGDTEPTDNPGHAGYPWAEDKEWPRTENVVIDGEHDVTVPVGGETVEGGTSIIEGGTTQTDTWNGEGEAKTEWTEKNEDDKDVKVEVDVGVTVDGSETSTDTTTSDSLGIHETTTIIGSETVKTEIDRTETVENPDEVDKYKGDSVEVGRGSNDESEYGDSHKNENPEQSTDPILGSNPQDVTVVVGAGSSATVYGDGDDNKDAATTKLKNELVEQLRGAGKDTLPENAEKDSAGKWVHKDESTSEDGKTTVTTTSIVENVEDGYKKTVITETVKQDQALSEALRTDGSTVGEDGQIKLEDLTEAEKQEAWSKLYTNQVEKLAEVAGEEVKPVTDENGKFAETVIDIKDEAGKVIGNYTVKPVYDADGKMTSYQLIKTVEKHDVASAQDSITLPERPLESVTTAENGEETRIVVTDRLDANGNVIGYVKTTTVTRPSGSVSTKTEVLSGTKTSASTTTADSTHIITTTVTDVVLNGSNSTVTTYEKVTETETKTIASVEPREVTVTMSAVTSNENDGKNTYKTLGPNGTTSGTTFEGEKLHFVEGGQTSGLLAGMVYDKNGNGVVDSGDVTVRTEAKMYIMQDSEGNKIAVYCAEKKQGTSNVPEYTLQKIEDASYISESNRSKLEYVVQNGYWGTSGSEAGSLEAVKSWYTNWCTNNNKTPVDTSSITAEVAIAATQCAIQLLSNSPTQFGTNSFIYADGLNGESVQLNKTFFYTASGGSTSETVRNAANALCNALIDAAKNQPSVPATEKPNTQFVTNNTVSSTVTVGAQASEGKYSTDVTIDLGVRPSAFNSNNFIVSVGNKQITLSTNSAGQIVGSSSSDGIEVIANGGTVQIRLTGFEMAHNADTTVRLRGEQRLGQGAYALVSGAQNHSQNMVVFVTDESTRTVDLEFTLKINVKEAGSPVITSVTTSETQTHNDYDFVIDPIAETEDVTFTTIETETIRHWDARTVETNTYVYGDDDDDDDDDDRRTGDDDDDGDDDEGDDDTTEITEEPTPLANTPEESAPQTEALEDDVEIPETIVPLAEAPEEEEEVEIPEEDVPLAEVPATGDISGMWYAMTIAAACGLVTLTFRKKEQDA